MVRIDQIRAVLRTRIVRRVLPVTLAIIASLIGVSTVFAATNVYVLCDPGQEAWVQFETGVGSVSAIAQGHYPDGSLTYGGQYGGSCPSDPCMADYWVNGYSNVAWDVVSITSDSYVSVVGEGCGTPPWGASPAGSSSAKPSGGLSVTPRSTTNVGPGREPTHIPATGGLRILPLASAHGNSTPTPARTAP